MVNMRVKMRNLNRFIAYGDADIFTGKLDKDGKEIYENDYIIATADKLKAKVVWADCGFKVEFLEGNRKGIVKWLGELESYILKVDNADVWKGSK
jgi:hypothetical protein